MRSFVLIVGAIVIAGLLAIGLPMLAFWLMGANPASAMQYGGLIAGAFITIISAAAVLIKLLRPSAA